MSSWGIWHTLPSGVDGLPNFTEFPRYPVGRQILVCTTVEPTVTAGGPVGFDFLTYNEKSPDIFVTHRAAICGYSCGQFEVALDMPRNSAHPVQRVTVSAAEIFRLNQPTKFACYGDVFTFEDKIRCKYSDFVTKAKVLEAALSIRHLVADLNFQKCIPGSKDFDESCAHRCLETQLNCVKQIVRVMDCVHFVAEGKLDPNRSTKQDVGRLALHGRGHCHTVASVVAALLLPFSELIGVEVRFRAGFFQEGNRDIDEIGNPVSSWNGIPRSTDDHTWLELTFIPSLSSYVVISTLSFSQVV